MTEAADPPRLVLVVDDYQDARDLYAACLESAGYRVVTARSGAEAVAEATARLPDLIVMDLSLPGMDGWEATRRLKADSRTRHIPVLALTGHALAGAAERARAAGCDAFVVRPCLPDELLREAARLLSTTSDPGGVGC